jgi:hypothetical protein
MDYPYYEDMVKDTRLVTRDGSEKRVSLMGLTGGGGGIENEEVWTTVHFIGLTDPSDFAAIRMGDYELPKNAPHFIVDKTGAGTYNMNRKGTVTDGWPGSINHRTLC